MSKSSIKLLDGKNERVLNLHQTFEILLTNNVSLLSGLQGLVSLSHPCHLLYHDKEQSIYVIPQSEHF